MMDLTKALKAARKRAQKCEREVAAVQRELDSLHAEKTDANVLAAIGDDDNGKASGLILLNDRIRHAELTLADAERALELARNEVALLEAEQARQEAAATATKLEYFGAELQMAAEGVDAAIVALREACERHHEVMAAIGKLCPELTRELVGLHVQHRYPMRAAVIHHGLAKYLPVEGPRFGTAPFASRKPLCITRRVAELRGEREEAA